MKFKVLLLLLTFLLGCSLTPAYPDYDEEAVDTSAAFGGSKDPSSDVTSQNDEIHDSSLRQQEVEYGERKYQHNLDMEMEAETEVSVKSVRNVSDNQLSQEQASMEHHHHLQEEYSEEQAAPQSTEQYVDDSKMEEEEAETETEAEIRDALNKKLRMGRLLPTTTTSHPPTNIPDYIVRQKTKTSEDPLNLSQENLNLSLSDYMEDEADEAVGIDHLQQQTFKRQHHQQHHHQPATKPSTVYEHVSSSHHQLQNSNENEDIVPLAMRYYDDDDDDDDDVDGGDRVAAHDDEYNGGNNNKLNNNEPVPMPQQQLLPRANNQRQQPFLTQQQQNSSEEYYDEQSSAPHEEDSSTSTAAAATAAKTTTTSTTAPEDNLVVFAGFPLSFQQTTTAPPQPLPAISSSSSIPPPPLVTPIVPLLNAQFDASLVTTTAPYPLVAAAAAAAAAPVASNSGDKKGKQIPISPTTTTSAAVPSTLPGGILVTSTTTTARSSSSRRRLLPHEQLRNYIEDAYIRMPLAVIVDPSAESLEKTKTLWNDALRSNLNIKIILVTLNESDIPAAFNFNNTRQFLTGLNSIKEHEGGDAFRGISHAAELVPYDSAVFISTATLANHTDQVHDAAITLLKKRIRLYLIWFGERALSENETQETVGGILGEVAIRSGGEVLHIVGSENSQELEGSTLTIVADAFRGSQEVDVPVDTTLSSLHVKIDKLMRRAVLETPNGEINLKKLVKFKTRLMITSLDDKRLDAYVPLNKLRKATVYKLKIIPDDLESEYTVFIRGERKADTFLDDMIKHFETYFYEGHTSYPARVLGNKLQSRTSAALTLADVPMSHSNIRFPDGTAAKMEPKAEVETFSSQEIHRNTEEALPTNSTSVTSANTMVNQRSTNVLQRSNTKIELGIHSQVLVIPGTMGQLYFEVTNTGCDSIFYNIQVTDERRYLMRLAPQSIFLRAGQMATVTVTVLAPQNTQTDTVDHITFSTTGAGTTTSLSINLKVTTTIDSQDNTSPTISWDFGSRCESVSSDAPNCVERFWTLYITAQDWQTGIMRLQSTPTAGLMYTSSSTIGTTEPLKATYIATCCEPKVNLVAYDVAGNQRSYSIDVRDLVLNDASIAAITLGAILLIVLIILIIAGIVWCCRRRKVILDLPTYRSHSTRSME